MSLNNQTKKEQSMGAPISFEEIIHNLRKEIKEVSETVKNIKVYTDNPGALANITLSYRHLEDATMRLGKVLQALNDGISIYDKIL